jgi:hypothetical protein
VIKAEVCAVHRSGPNNYIAPSLTEVDGEIVNWHSTVLVNPDTEPGHAPICPWRR